MTYQGFTPVDCAGGKVRINVNSADGSSNIYTQVLQISRGILWLKARQTNVTNSFSNGAAARGVFGYDWYCDIEGPVLVESFSAGIYAATALPGFNVSFDLPGVLPGETLCANRDFFAVFMAVTAPNVLTYKLKLECSGPGNNDENGFGMNTWITNAAVSND